MNELFHFYTAYLLNRLMVKTHQNRPFSHRGVVAWYAGFCGMIPDILEYQIGSLGHGTWSHTILFGMLLALGSATFFYLLGHDFWRSE